MLMVLTVFFISVDMIEVLSWDFVNVIVMMIMFSAAI